MELDENTPPRAFSYLVEFFTEIIGFGQLASSLQHHHRTTLLPHTWFSLVTFSRFWSIRKGRCLAFPTLTIEVTYLASLPR